MAEGGMPASLARLECRSAGDMEPGTRAAGEALTDDTVVQACAASAGISPH